MGREYQSALLNLYVVHEKDGKQSIIKFVDREKDRKIFKPQPRQLIFHWLAHTLNMLNIEPGVQRIVAYVFFFCSYKRIKVMKRFKNQFTDH
jgi:hypothetical protein